MFNDVAVAIRVLFRDRLAASAAVVDLDVHHGNGTAFIFAGDAARLHVLDAPAAQLPGTRSRAGSLDIGLPRGTGDDAYLEPLDGALAPGARARCRTWCSIWPAPIPTRTISSAAWR